MRGFEFARSSLVKTGHHEAAPMSGEEEQASTAGVELRPRTGSYPDCGSCLETTHEPCILPALRICDSVLLAFLLVFLVQATLETGLHCSY
ncbi:hypothetical protein BP00DRAFT_166898 [Aspergillus indologenus CBS 114.80]|uniref:Uncharacterized protein n=1 Tax=Aspergillus indologenus CBS 114.80 TaxID=1450541 RepID=A0A2V5IT13_9EURO|nr:hypothetical protein BP00DRAFT_166898 [Aspergillus indologenus CBS 114.80]